MQNDKGKSKKDRKKLYGFSIPTLKGKGVLLPF